MQKTAWVYVNYKRQKARRKFGRFSCVFERRKSERERASVHMSDQYTLAGYAMRTRKVKNEGVWDPKKNEILLWI